MCKSLNLNLPPNYRLQATAGGALTPGEERRRSPAAPEPERWADKRSRLKSGVRPTARPLLKPAPLE
jgi:hypothetical protein